MNMHTTCMHWLYSKFVKSETLFYEMQVDNNSILICHLPPSDWHLRLCGRGWGRMCYLETHGLRQWKRLWRTHGCSSLGLIKGELINSKTPHAFQCKITFLQNLARSSIEKKSTVWNKINEHLNHFSNLFDYNFVNFD